MDYKKLPLEKRIQLASKYAPLLMADVRSKMEIIGILKNDYALTKEQALLAFEMVFANRKPVMDEFDKTMFTLAVLSFLLLCIISYQYFSAANILRESEIATIEKCVITVPVTRERTRGKHPQNYYLLSCRGRSIRFRFYDNFYKYSTETSQLATVKPGDTITVQILKKNLGFYEDRYSYGDVDIVNLDLGKGFLIDHNYRNARILEYDKSAFYMLLTVFGGIILIIMVRKGINYIDSPYRFFR